MIEQLLMQVDSLTATLDSLQQSFDAQTALIVKLNQTIQEIKEQINKSSKNSSKLPFSDGLKSLPQRAYANLPERKPAVRRGIRGNTLQSLQIPMILSDICPLHVMNVRITKCVKVQPVFPKDVMLLMLLTGKKVLTFDRPNVSIQKLDL